MKEEVRREPAPDEPCPCGSDLAYGTCCGAIAGETPGPVQDPL